MGPLNDGGCGWQPETRLYCHTDRQRRQPVTRHRLYPIAGLGHRRLFCGYHRRPRGGYCHHVMAFPLQGQSPPDAIQRCGNQIKESIIPDHLSGRTAGHCLCLSDAVALQCQQHRAGDVGTYGYLCFCRLHESPADLQPLPGWCLSHHPVVGCHSGGQGRQRGIPPCTAQVFLVYHRGHDSHLRRGMGRSECHLTSLRSQRPCHSCREQPCPAHLLTKLHSLLLHLCYHDCLQALRPSSHGPVHLLRPVADGHPRALAGVQVCARSLVVQLLDRIHH